jgi:hypothetical protein
MMYLSNRHGVRLCMFYQDAEGPDDEAGGNLGFFVAEDAL